LLDLRRAPPALLEGMALAHLTNAQVLALLDVMALVWMINAKVNVRLDHTQLVALLLLLVHLVAQVKPLL
jgi:hypothetical protein